MNRTGLALGLALAYFIAHDAFADPFPCGSSAVETGMGTTKQEVLDKCGPPSEKDTDHWYYKHQTGQVTVVLTFENDQLQGIERIPE